MREEPRLAGEVVDAFGVDEARIGEAADGGGELVVRATRGEQQLGVGAEVEVHREHQVEALGVLLREVEVGLALQVEALDRVRRRRAGRVERGVKHDEAGFGGGGQQGLLVGEVPVGRCGGDAGELRGGGEGDRPNTAIARDAQRGVDEGLTEVAVVVGGFLFDACCHVRFVAHPMLRAITFEVTAFHMQTRTSSRPFGQQSPFRANVDNDTADVVVEGTVPAWLNGRLVRTAPVVFQHGDWQADHWFDGLGMFYGFTIDGGSSDPVRFRQRLLASRIAADPLRFASFGTKQRRSFFKRMLQPIPVSSDNTNVHIVPMGDDLVALTETNVQYVIDPDTLHTLRPLAWQDELSAQATIAHPQYDKRNDVIVNVGPVLGRDGGIVVVEHAPSSRTRRVVGRWKTGRVPYVHSFGLSDRHVVLIGHPFTVNPLSMLWSNGGFIDHFQWKPDAGTRFARMDRGSGVVVEHTAEAIFVFHTVQTFEEVDATVVDVVAFADASIVAKLQTGALGAAFPDQRARLLRVRLVHGRERAEVTPLSDTGFEFPSVSSARAASGATAVWGASLWSDDGPRSRIVKVDTKTGAAIGFSDDDLLFGEPVFVRRPGAVAEDDGVVLTVGSHRDGARATLQILDGQGMAPIARATIDVPLPLGFHGSFVRAR